MARNQALPPLDHLLAFEATALTGSFVNASKELNISETAISRKVRLLELHYNVMFFRRSHRAITMTAQGQAFLNDIRPALDKLRDASVELLGLSAQRAVTIAATNSVSTFWLMPRLRQLRSEKDPIKIMLVSSDEDAKCLNENNDLIILRGNGNWPGFSSKLLFRETIFPVCSPEYLAAHADVRDLKNLARQERIEVSNNHPEWMNWQTWLGHFDANPNAQASPHPTNQTTIFNTYPLAIQGALEGLGLTLGWAHLLDPLLASGQLVKPLGDICVNTDFGYYLLKNDKHKDFSERRIILNWLLMG